MQKLPQKLTIVSIILLLVILGSRPYMYISNNEKITNNRNTITQRLRVRGGAIGTYLFVTPDSSFRAVEWAINNASETIYMVFYEFWHPGVYRLLKDAAYRGVQIKVVLEGDVVGTAGDNWNRNMAYNLSNLPNTVVKLEDTTKIVHAKFMIIDNNTVLVASENMLPSAFPEDPTNIWLTPYTTASRGWGVLINNTYVAEQFLDVFLDLYTNRSRLYDPISDGDGYAPYDNGYLEYSPSFKIQSLGGIENISCVFSPLNSYTKILDLLTKASKQVFIEQIYIYNDTEPIQDFMVELRNARSRGATIQIIMEDNNIGGYNATGDQLNSAGFHTVPAFYYMPGTLFLHNKGIIVDDEYVFVGSINWSGNAIVNNTEAGVILHSKEAAQYFKAVFAFDWKKSSNANFDSDGDGLSDVYEEEHGTNKLSVDTDGDGLSDYDEVFVYGTDPTKSDAVAVYLDEPQDNSFVNSTEISVAWRSENSEFVTSYGLYLNDTLIDILSSDVQSYVLSGLADESCYTLEVRPTTSIPVKKVSAYVTFYIDTKTPKIELGNQINGSSVNTSTVRLSINISDYSLDSIKIKNNGTIVYSSTAQNKTYRLDIEIPLLNGLNEIKIIATDKAGNIAITKIYVTKSTETTNQEPTNPNNESSSGSEPSTSASSMPEEAKEKQGFQIPFEIIVVAVIVVIIMVAVLKKRAEKS